MYSRLFITMRVDAAGYGFGGRAPIGRCILEMRGSVLKAVLTVQDIKPNVNYKVYIVEKPNECGTPPQGVQVGNIAVDAQGRGELRKEFDGAFAGKLYFDEIGVVVLVVSKDAGNDTPLVGFVKDEFASEYNWKSFVSDGNEHRNKTAAEYIEPAIVERDDTTIMEQAIVGRDDHGAPLQEVDENDYIETTEVQLREEDINECADVEAVEILQEEGQLPEEEQPPEAEPEEEIIEPVQVNKQANIDMQDELFKQNEVERIFAAMYSCSRLFRKIHL